MLSTIIIRGVRLWGGVALHPYSQAYIRSVLSKFYKDNTKLNVVLTTSDKIEKPIKWESSMAVYSVINH